MQRCVTLHMSPLYVELPIAPRNCREPPLRLRGLCGKGSSPANHGAPALLPLYPPYFSPAESAESSVGKAPVRRVAREVPSTSNRGTRGNLS
jgi:hypothetical protein